MYIYALIDDSNMVKGYEIVEVKKAESATQKNIAITPEFDTSFYEGFDGFRVDSETVDGVETHSLVKLNDTTVSSKRHVAMSVEGIVGSQNITPKMANAILYLPWNVERSNIVSDFKFI